MTRFIFITGGVVSSLGKGLSSAALGALLQARGFKVRLRKLDPYLNVDPGTMSPYQHGEVYVTDDGAETDLDLGHYERFTGISCRKSDSVTTGKIYQGVIAKERRGDYLGATIQVIPHVTDAIKDWIKADITDEDFVLCEIGGTVGDIESLPFLEAIRQLGNELGPERSMFVHLTLIPYIPAAGELKTKPTQHSVKELQSVGIQPDILLCRCDREIPAESRRKIAQFCNVRPTAVIQALDVDTIYAVTGAYHEQGFDDEVCRHFNLGTKAPDLKPWHDTVERIRHPDPGRAARGDQVGTDQSGDDERESQESQLRPQAGPGSTIGPRQAAMAWGTHLDRRWSVLPNPRHTGQYRRCRRAAARRSTLVGRSLRRVDMSYTWCNRGNHEPHLATRFSDVFAVRQPFAHRARRRVGQRALFSGLRSACARAELVRDSARAGGVEFVSARHV